MAKVFVSHSADDRDFIEREIIEPLRRHGMEFWYARTSIEAAAQWERSILKGLKESDWFLVALSPRSAQSPWVKREIDWAFLHGKTGRIVPALLENCDADDFHIGMAGLQLV